MTYSMSQTFTRTEARHLASKVVADLYQCSRLYGGPSMGSIPAYETELVERLAMDYVSKYEFGFEKDGNRVVAWQYQVKNGELAGGIDDRAGGLYARGDVSGASFYNFMTYSSKWSQVPASEQAEFEETLPFNRSDGTLPSDGSGYWISDKTYSRGGVAVTRRTFRP
ncbi:hypothetical protein [Streptomyces sp. SID13031]|uniref:HORMA-1 domain-containing protein n=1 Tax=Streptomyces sp. SID13031 TaxID=2706046 RepID=UPI0013C792F0|nr:hypothetical protein [Streptomyces sp. SID13031]NEA30224.1 hypothetical protein [Streptomyces sp. SID13031]